MLDTFGPRPPETVRLKIAVLLLNQVSLMTLLSMFFFVCFFCFCEGDGWPGSGRQCDQGVAMPGSRLCQTEGGQGRCPMPATETEEAIWAWVGPLCQKNVTLIAITKMFHWLYLRAHKEKYTFCQTCYLISNTRDAPTSTPFLPAVCPTEFTQVHPSGSRRVEPVGESGCGSGFALQDQRYQRKGGDN